ncbi:cold shock domain-containing protein [Mesorhizobium sp. B2-3-13]|nr:cold shock domain-containing protein [Mesorhizobium sp. B2-3-13]
MFQACPCFQTQFRGVSDFRNNCGTVMTIELDARSAGKITAFMADKGYGFIFSPDLTNSLFFHISAVRCDPIINCEGTFRYILS